MIISSFESTVTSGQRSSDVPPTTDDQMSVPSSANSRVSIRSNFSLSKEKKEKEKCQYHSKNESSKENNETIKKELKKVVLKGKKKENNVIKDS